MNLDRGLALFTGALLVALSMTSADAAAAVSITNRDDKEHKLTILEEDGAKKTDHVLKPSQVLEGICAKGCIVRLNDSEEDEYELEGMEIVSIEEGYLYYDGPEGPAAPQTGAQPAQPAPAAPPAKQ
jgi:hypothetical protein